MKLKGKKNEWEI